MKRKIALAALAVLFFAGLAQAQTAPLKVFVSPGSNQESRDMAARLAGRIGASNRYALALSGPGVRLSVEVDCMNIIIRQEIRSGVACFITYSDFPWRDQNVFLSVPIDGRMALGPEDYVTEMLFDNFISATADESLTKWEAQPKVIINATILQHPNGIK